jgi:glucan 1,3-beta-glucosidase
VVKVRVQDQSLLLVSWTFQAIIYVRQYIHLDSHFSGVPHAITVTATSKGIVPSIVLDNLLIENTESIVVLSNGTTIVQGSTDPITVKSWATGDRFTTIDNIGVQARGLVSPSPIKSPILLDETGKFFERCRPQYENLTADNFLIATEHGISNDATGDQTGAINSLLIGSNGTPVFFPAGVYLVEGTVFVPTGSVIVGEGDNQNSRIIA